MKENHIHRTGKMVMFAANRHTNRVCIMDGFRYWEEVQGAACCGILMPDGQSANGIGKIKTLAEFIRRANHGKTTILVADDSPQLLEIEVNGSRSKVSPSIWRSYAGHRFMAGIECHGERFLFLTNEVYHGAIAGLEVA